MAKRCLDKITVDGVDYPLMQLNDFSIFNNYTGWDIDCSNAGYSYISSYGYDIMAIGGDRWISSGYKDWDIINSNDGAVRIQNNNWNSVAKNIIFDKSDSNCRTRNSYNSSNQNLNMWCAIIVDDETELGFAIIVRQFPNGGTKDAWIYNDSNNDYAYCKKIYQCFGNVAQKITSNGGGATHIAKRTGQLKNLSSYISDILMVSGGGGGGLLVGDTDYSGKEAGGISGSGDNSADQSTGNAFGQGESGTNVSGGGSGLYGGYKGASLKSGGAGSGYIGNSLLSNKKMVGYNVPTSSAEGTKTESVNEISASAVSGKPKSGNGFARIKFLREVEQFRSIDLPLANRIVPAKFKPEYAYYYGRQEVPKGEQYYDIEGATAITIQRGGADSFTFGDLPAYFGIYDPNSSNVVNWYLRKVNSSGATMLVDGSNTGSFSPDGNCTFYVIAGGEPFNPNGKGYFTVIRTTDWSNGWGGLAFSTEVMTQLRNYFA